MRAEPMPVEEIQLLLRRARMDYRQVIARTKIRRLLVHRDPSANPTETNGTGTNIPDPFSRSPLIVRTLIGQVVEAVLHYQSRFAANAPVPVVMPLTVKDELTAKVDRTAGQQELFYAFLLDQMGIGASNRWNQRKCAFAQATSEAAYYVITPRDMGFGLPMRDYFTDEEAEAMRKAGKPVSQIRTDKGWAEHPDAWGRRKKEAMKAKAINLSGNGLFDLQCYPRDMVRVGKDSDGIKWGAVVREIPGSDLTPGSSLARSAARQRGVPMDDWDYYGIWKGEKGRIIGGIERGGPQGGRQTRSWGTWTLIQFYTRLEVIYLVASADDTEGAFEVYRAKHGARIQGQPVCPIVEVPAMRTDIDTVGQDFVGPMSQVFAIAPLVNQLMTLLSNVGVFNAIPRWVVELQDGSILRGEDGEPKIIDSDVTFGLDPREAAAVPGTLKQLTIDSEALLKLIPIYLELLADAMPSPAAMGDAASSATAWAAQQNVAMSQLTLQEPVENHSWAVNQLLLMVNEWLRDLDVPVYFFEAPQGRADKRVGRGLVEFNPSDLTDSFRIVQDLNTPDEKVVLIQIGMTLLESGLIDLRNFYENYMKVADAREAMIERWQQAIVDHVMGVRPASPESMIYQIAEGVRGQVHYELLQTSMNYALGNARMQAQMANQQAMMTQDNSTLAGGVSEAAGVRRPGMGMNPSLEGQLGGNAPQVSPQIPAGVVG